MSEVGSMLLHQKRVHKGQLSVLRLRPDQKMFLVKFKELILMVLCSVGDKLDQVN